MDNFKKYYRFGLVIFFVIIAIIALKVFPRYINKYDTLNANNEISLIVGVKDETDRLIDPLIIKNNRILFSYDNIKRFIDSNITLDEKYNQIITTSKTNVKIIDYKNSTMRELLDNSSEKIHIEIIEDKMYFDLSELSEIYGIDIKYNDNFKIVSILKNIHTYKVGEVIKSANLKTFPSVLSGNIDEFEEGNKVYIVQTDGEYYKVRDEIGRFGYVNKECVGNIINTTNYIDNNTFDGKISMVWDYVNLTTPDRTSENKVNSINVMSPTWIDLQNEKAEILDKSDKRYINWAKKNDYDIWVLFTNNSMIKTTSEIMNDSKLREKLIKNTLDVCIKNGFDGINVDFENMYKEDINAYSQFIRELSVAFNKHNIIVSVDVTVPDGSDTWSLCYDRKAIGEAANYVVLMAYDQTPVSSKKPGSVAAVNWVEANVNKLIKEVDKEKLILGIPLYTRVWKTDSNEKTTSSTIDMKNIPAYLVKNNLKITWNAELGQHVVEYSRGNDKYVVWIEDSKSIEEKLKIFKKYDLAGIAFWEKDRESSEIWNLVEQYMNK